MFCLRVQLHQPLLIYHDLAWGLFLDYYIHAILLFLHFVMTLFNADFGIKFHVIKY